MVTVGESVVYRRKFLVEILMVPSDEDHLVTLYQAEDEFLQLDGLEGAAPGDMVDNAWAGVHAFDLAASLPGLILGGMVTPDRNIGGGIGAMLGLGISLLLLKVTEKYRRGKPGWNPEVIEILPRGAATEGTDGL